jgi:hypothetical protein
MMALCTQLDVEQRLQWDITAEPEPVVTTLIASAQAHIEAEVGRPLESAERSETFDWGRVALLLKFWPVTAIDAVLEDGDTLTETTDFLLKNEDRLIRVANGYQTRWRTYKPQSITVQYTGGYLSPDHDSQLEHLGSICAEVVARAFRRGAASAALPPDAAGAVQSVSLVGSDSITYATGGGESFSGGGVSQFVYLTEDEIRQLQVYKRNGHGFA